MEWHSLNSGPTFFRGLSFFALVSLLLLNGGLSRAVDKSGVSPTAISVPKGPGSIEGLGESFQPSLNSGQAQYSVPLRLPPGPGGKAPSLGLRYEGGAGNGVLGPGWSLPLPLVQRQSDHGLPTYGEPVGFERVDTFINEAREVLVPTEEGYSYCKNEGAFIRYQFATNHWIGTRPDGSKLEFGVTPSGRIEQGEHVDAWLLETVTDLHGNVERYRYAELPGEANRSQKYLRMIEYGAGAPPWKARHFIWFEYETRPDPILDARAGFLVGTGLRLKSMTVATEGVDLPGHQTRDVDGNGVVDAIDRKYVLDYLGESEATPPVSLLTRVRMSGADESTALPPLSFSYAVCKPASRIDATPGRVDHTDAPLFLMDSPLVDFLDLNGDGLPDLIKTDSGGGAHQAFLNQGESSTAESRSVHWASAQEVSAGGGAAWNYHLGQSETHLADMDGDGLADLVHRTATGETFYFANLGEVGWGIRQPVSTSLAPPPAPFGETDVRTGDFDFDKRMDIIQSINNGGGYDYRVWFKLADQTYSSPVTVAQANGYSFADPSVQITDLNGDRVVDIARIRPNSIEVTLGLGYGRFAPLQTLVLPDGPLTTDQVSHARLIDVNGDGLADLVIERAAPGECWYWLNGDHGQLTEHRVISALPLSVGQNAAVRWADVNGNGSVDLVYADREADPRLVSYDLGLLFACAPAPNLMLTISNGLGRVTRIGYDPSTRFLTEDAAAGEPWLDRVPFPVTVVSSITTEDSLGHAYMTRFRYHDGYYDPVEKQFRGFGRVDQVEVGDATAPTLVTTFHFDTGRLDEAMKGKTLRKKVGTEDGKLFTDEITEWQTPSELLFTGTDGREIRFAHPVSESRDLLERGVGEKQRTETEMEFDRYGNRIRLAEYGRVINGDRLAGEDERITETQYAINLPSWILRSPSRIERSDATGHLSSRSDFFYDDETFAGNNPGLVVLGNLTLKQEWKLPTDPASKVNIQRTRYDRFGNPILQLDALAVVNAGVPDLARGHAHELEYDAAFKAHVTKERAHTGGPGGVLETSAEYDVGLGNLVRVVDFNGFVTDYRTDGLGRLTSMKRPGDTSDFPSVEYEYHLGVTNETGVVNFVETHQLDKPSAEGGADRLSRYQISRSYTDGLGRSLSTRSEAEPAAGSVVPRVVVTEARLFNARQGTALNLQPHYTTRSGNLTQLLEFEKIDGAGWKGAFEREGAQVVVNLQSAPKSVQKYDAQLRLVESRNPDGTVRRTEFEPLLEWDFDENDTDPNSPHVNTPAVRLMDGLGRLIEVRELQRMTEEGLPVAGIESRVTQYHYDTHDQLVRSVDAFGNERTFAYDGLQRRVRLNDPDRGSLALTLDDGSNILEILDAKGQRTSFTYDGLNRRLTETYHGAAALPPWRRPEGAGADVIYHYDVGVPTLEQGNGARDTAQGILGRLAWVEDLSGEEHNSFDARGRLAWVVKRLPIDPAFGRELSSFRTGFNYDLADRLSGVIYPDGDQVSYEHNERGLVRSVSGSTTGSLLPRLEYSVAGHLAQMNYGNGFTSAYQYDDRLRVTGLELLRPASGGGARDKAMDLRYAMDAASNIESIQDRRSAAVVPAGDVRRNQQQFVYDDLNRLVEASYSFQPASPGAPSATDGGSIRYRYDAIGNLLQQDLVGGPTLSRPSASDLGSLAYGGSAGRRHRLGRQSSDAPGPHALTRLSKGSTTGGTTEVTYDANGNVSQLLDIALGWDFKDRMVSAESAEFRADYLYDYADRRVAKRIWSKNGGTSTASVVLYVDQYFEVREGNQIAKYGWLGSSRIAKTSLDFSSGPKVQYVPLREGWNAWVSEVGFRWTPGDARVAPDAGAVWNGTAREFVALRPGDAVASGAILWVHSSRAGFWPVSGLRGTPFNGEWQAGPDFMPVPQSWSSSSSIPDGSSVWIFDGDQQEWRTWSSSPLGTLRDAKPSWWHGQVGYIQWPAQVQWHVPSAAEQLVFYHADHLGSATLITDGSGTVAEERAFYAFGLERNHFVAGERASEPYGFSQKEVDRETGFAYFESRFLNLAWARFLRTDPLITTVKADWLKDPQNGNPYAYCKNRPLNSVDPDGMDPISLGGGFKIDPFAPSASFSKGGVDVGANTSTATAAYANGAFKANLLFNYNLSGGGGFSYKAFKTAFTVDFKSGAFTLSPSYLNLNSTVGYNPQSKVFSFSASGKFDKLSLSAGVSSDKSFSVSASYGAALLPFPNSDSFSKSIYAAEAGGRDLANVAGSFQGDPIKYYQANSDRISGDIDKVKAGYDNASKVTKPYQFGAGLQLSGSTGTSLSLTLGAQGSF